MSLNDFLQFRQITYIRLDSLNRRVLFAQKLPVVECCVAGCVGVVECVGPTEVIEDRQFNPPLCVVFSGVAGDESGTTRL